MTENVDKFIEELQKSLADGSFVKLTLGNYKGVDEHLQKLLVRLVRTKKGVRLFFLYRSDTRDTAKNYDTEMGVALIAEALDTGFHSAHLFTTAADLQLEIGKKGKSRLNSAKPTFNAPAADKHDREKALQIRPDSFYLRSLGITDDTGRVRDRSQDKWKQINKFVEVLASLVDKSGLSNKRSLRIVDMGSGKGYLTFAAYDYFANVRGLDVKMTGVDTRRELVELCNGIAAAGGFDGLEFVVGSIEGCAIDGVDILIALHACNTASDDAIFKGIIAEAGLIVAAPCCHQELRPQMTPPPMLRNILKHGVMLERTAETLTDGIRAALLETHGYSTKFIEFVPVEHTPKNNMLVGTKLAATVNTDELQQELKELKAAFGIREQRLQKLLDSSDVLAE